QFGVLTHQRTCSLVGPEHLDCVERDGVRACGWGEAVEPDGSCFCGGGAEPYAVLCHSIVQYEADWVIWFYWSCRRSCWCRVRLTRPRIRSKGIAVGATQAVEIVMDSYSLAWGTAYHYV